MNSRSFQNSEVAKWYAGKYILITGVTGFMGKVLLEKLLRACPEVNRIYLLIRYKRGATPEDRLNNIFVTPLFDILRKENPKVFEKVTIIQGDVSKEDLGLSEEDRDELAQNVSVVFHSAATVKFDEPLKYAVEMNIIGTELIIQLCYEMKKLEAFIYLSTAFSNCHLPAIEERVYEPPYNLEKLKMCLECLDDEMLNELKKRLIKNRPNTYSFTKAMAENVIKQHSNNLPLIILRPSIVVGSLDEPFSGWVDNLNGPAGIFLAIGKGLIRTLIGNGKCVADIIPVDISINMMICIAWYTAKYSNKNMLVYNLVASGSNPITWDGAVGLSEHTFRNYPVNEVLWYPNYKFRSNLFEHEIVKIFLHDMPAKTIDFFTTIFGGKPMLVSGYKQINAAINAMAFFTSNQWYFEKKNANIVFESMNETDQKLFNFDFSKIVWTDFIEKYSLGIKQHVLKESLDTLPSCRKKMKKLKTVYFGLIIMLFLIFFAMVYFGYDIIYFFLSYAYKGIILLFAAIYYYFHL